MENSVKKTGFIGALSLIAAAVAVILIKQFLFITPSFDTKMMEIASDMNKNCPMMVDQQTRLDQVMALPNKVFQYNYTLLAAEMATLDTADFRNFMEPKILDNVKSNPDLKTFRYENVTLRYVYKDKYGAIVIKISITPSMYSR